jgi:hypothetical protein
MDFQRNLAGELLPFKYYEDYEYRTKDGSARDVLRAFFYAHRYEPAGTGMDTNLPIIRQIQMSS